MLVVYISVLSLYELTTLGNIVEPSVAAEILAVANQTISLNECAFLADNGYDVKSIYNTVKRSMRMRHLFSSMLTVRKPLKRFLQAIRSVQPNLLCTRAKTTDNGRTHQKYCCPFHQSKTGACPCSHKNWSNGKKNLGCTKYKTVLDDYRH